MKTTNLTKEFLCQEIKELRKKIRQTKCNIQTCEVVCKREKTKLKNTNESHETLWHWRYKLELEIELLMLYRKRLKKLDNLLNKKFNPHNNKISAIICFI